MARNYYLAVYFLLKTGEAYGSIRSAYKYTHRTTLRLELDSWLWFKNWCHEKGITTCFVMRCWIEELRARETYRKKYRGLVAKKSQPGYTPWKYYVEAQSLIRWRLKNNQINPLDRFQQPSEGKHTHVESYDNPNWKFDPEDIGRPSNSIEDERNFKLPETKNIEHNR